MPAIGSGRRRGALATGWPSSGVDVGIGCRLRFFSDGVWLIPSVGCALGGGKLGLPIVTVSEGPPFAFGLRRRHRFPALVAIGPGSVATPPAAASAAPSAPTAAALIVAVLCRRLAALLPIGPGFAPFLAPVVVAVFIARIVVHRPCMMR